MVLNILVGFISLLHFYFLVLEMFLWATPIGQKIFGHSAEHARSTAVLAANQGLYNGFLAAGLVWGLLESNPEFSQAIKFFFLACVLIAGLYGAWSVSSKIFFVQAMPAAIVLILLFLNRV